MLGIFGKLLDSNEKEIKKLKSIVENINNLEKKTSKLADKQLRGKFAEFRSVHEKGKSLDELLPEVFAFEAAAFFGAVDGDPAPGIRAHSSAPLATRMGF